jgi:hypothetical protein
MPNALTAWPDERTERLKVLWAEGASSATVIGRELGMSRNAILGKVHRLGLESRAIEPRPKVTKAEKQRVAIDNPSDFGGVRRPSRVNRTRAHEGMRTISIAETNRILQEPTKNQLRAMLAEAVRNTAAMG